MQCVGVLSESKIDARVPKRTRARCRRVVARPPRRRAGTWVDRRTGASATSRNGRHRPCRRSVICPRRYPAACRWRPPGGWPAFTPIGLRSLAVPALCMLFASVSRQVGLGIHQECEAIRLRVVSGQRTPGEARALKTSSPTLPPGPGRRPANGRSTRGAGRASQRRTGRCTSTYRRLCIERSGEL
jgi:hypothetical protein